MTTRQLGPHSTIQGDPLPEPIEAAAMSETPREIGESAMPDAVKQARCDTYKLLAPLIAKGIEFIQTERNGLADGITIRGELSTDPEEAPTRAAIEQMDRWLRLAHGVVAAADTIETPDPWQPIETAPDDGSVILVWWPYWHQYPMTAYVEHSFWHSVGDLALASPGIDDANGPTHWMPLPTPPAQEGAGDE